MGSHQLPGQRPQDRRQGLAWSVCKAEGELRTMRFGSTAKVLAECQLKYYRISECSAHLQNHLLSCLLKVTVWEHSMS